MAEVPAIDAGISSEEVLMRYRIRVTRVQIATRHVVAKDEEHAMEKIRSELDQPYGFLGQWQTVAWAARRREWCMAGP